MPGGTCWSPHPPFLKSVREEKWVQSTCANKGFVELTQKVLTVLETRINLIDILVCLFAEEVSAPLSFPARSMSENFPWSVLFILFCLRITWKTACDLELWALAEVCPEVRMLLPWLISFKTSSTHSTTFSVSPTITTCCFPSSRTRSFDFPDRRSNTWLGGQTGKG